MYRVPDAVQRAVSLLPAPLRGRVGVGGATRTESCWVTPLPVAPPQGGRERCGNGLAPDLTSSRVRLCVHHAEFPRQAHPAADPDTVLRVDPDLFVAATVAGRSGAADGARRARSQRHRPDLQA